MPAWATVALTLGASAIAVAGTFGAAWFSQRTTRRERERLERNELRRRGADVLAPIGVLLSDIEPLRLGITAGPQTREILFVFRDRWLPLRDALARFSSSEASDDVALLGQRLIVAVSNVIASTSWFVSDLPSGTPNARLRAENDHGLAMSLLDLLNAAVRSAESAGIVERLQAFEGQHREIENRLNAE